MPTDAERAKRLGYQWVQRCKMTRTQILIHPKHVDETSAILFADFIQPVLEQTRQEAEARTWEQAISIMSEAYHGALSDGCDANGAYDCAIEALRHHAQASKD